MTENEEPLVVRLDHLVLTVRDPQATVRFYEAVLGMKPVRFGEGRLALQFGNTKINLHQAGLKSRLTLSAPRRDPRISA